MDLNDYYYFVHVYEKKGFTQAGKALGIPKSRLSRHVKNLEEQLGVTLIQRTSRQFNVTDLGELFYQHARHAVDEIDNANAVIEHHKKDLTGKIRMSCSVGMAQFVLSDLVAEFLNLHPNVEIIQQVTNETIDLVSTGVDLAIRAHTGPLPDSSLIQRRLAPAVWGLFASPSYLKEAGIPLKPEDLDAHKGLKLGWQPEVGNWTLTGNDGSNFSVPFQPQLCSDDMVTLKHAAATGLGVVGLPLYICREDVRVNRLIRVLPDWTAGDAEISLLMPSRKGVLPVVTVFVNYLRERFPVVVRTD